MVCVRQKKKPASDKGIMTKGESRKMQAFKSVPLIAAALFLFGVAASCKEPAEEIDLVRQTADNFAADYAAGNYEKMLSDYTLDDALRSQLTLEVLSRYWNETILAMSGPFERLDTENAIYDKSSSTYTYPYICQYQTAYIMVGITSDNVIFAFVSAGFDNTTEISFPDNVAVSGGEFGDPDFPVRYEFVRPIGEGAFPCVAFVSESGALTQGIFGQTGPNAIYRDIAVGLAQRGIGTLLYEFRQNRYGVAVGEYLSIQDEYLDDMLYALSFLKNQSSVDADRIYLAGHGIGAYMIPLLSYYAELDDVEGLILLAINSSPLEDLAVQQYETLSMLDGEISSDEELGIEEEKRMRDNIKALNEGNMDQYSANELLGHTASYWLALQNFDAALTLEAIDIPMLLCFAQYDYQVPITEKDAFATHLEGRSDVQIVELSNTNHHFMPAEEMLGPMSYYAPATVDSRVMDDIQAFIAP